MILVEKIPEEVYEEDGNTRGYKALIGDSNAPAKDMNKCSEASGCGRNSIQPWYLLKWALSRPAEEAIVAAHERAKESINDLDLNVSTVSCPHKFMHVTKIDGVHSSLSRFLRSLIMGKAS